MTVYIVFYEYDGYGEAPHRIFDTEKKAKDFIENRKYPEYYSFQKWIVE